jgi:hypothetical protein
MKLTKLVAIAFILGSVSAGALSAQNALGSTPSEFPPSSYLGKQYVDSAGCVFIRAGIDGNVSWVPRVTRKRSGVCGFKPTFAGQVSPAPEPVRTAQVTQITNPAPVAVPKPRRVAAAAPAPKPKPRVVRQVAQRPAPIVEKTVQYAPSVVQNVQRSYAQPSSGGTACPGASAIAQHYLPRGDFAVRCGPQGGSIVGARISGDAMPRTVTSYGQQRRVATAAPTINVSPDRRIVPQHVAVNRVNTNNVTVPRGYKKVWDDDRLNPHRAEQSLAGHNAMMMIWTSTVPRRLINQSNGADVTASVPLVYPYTDYAAQQRDLGQVTIVQRNGQTLKRIVRNVTGLIAPEPRQARVATLQRTPTYSSRSAPLTTSPKPAAAAVAGNGYVQVGRFSSADAAQNLAQKVQRMGLPVRVGVYNSNGQTSRLVIAGPFGGQNDVKRAISRLRNAGYNAVAR